MRRMIAFLFVALTLFAADAHSQGTNNPGSGCANSVGDNQGIDNPGVNGCGADPTRYMMVAERMRVDSTSTNAVQSAAFTGSITTTTLTVTAVSSGTIANGNAISGSGVTAGTTVSGGGPCASGNVPCTLTVSASQSVVSEAMLAGLPNMISQVALITPKWACKNPRFVFGNWFGKEQLASPEVDGANSTPIDGFAVSVSGVFTSGTFSSSAGTTLAAGGVVISDAVAVTIPANSNAGTAYIRTSVTATNLNDTIVGFLNLNNTLTGEHASVASSLAAQSWGLTTGTASGTQTRAFGPIAMLCQGWDGSPVLYLAGDSICEGKGDITEATRGVLGYLPRGLDSTSGGSLAYSDWCVASTSPAVTSEGATTAGHYLRRIQAITAMAELNTNSAMPFTTIIVEHGVNNASNVGTANPAFWSMMHVQFPGAYVYQATITPHTDGTNAAPATLTGCIGGNSSCNTTGTLLTVSAVGSGTIFNTNAIAGAGVNAATTVSSGGPLSGAGSLTISPSQAAVASEAMTSTVIDGNCTAASSDYCWVDITHQLPAEAAYNSGGIIATFNTAIMDGTTYTCAHLGGTSCIDGYVDTTPQIWTSLANCLSGTQSACTWVAPAFTTTLAAQANSGSSSFSMTAAPAVGDDLVFVPGTTAVEAYKSGGLDGGGYVVSTVTGTGPFTVGMTGSSGSTQSTHANGTAVAEAYSNSGLHPNVAGHVLMATGVINSKSSLK